LKKYKHVKNVFTSVVRIFIALWQPRLNTDTHTRSHKKNKKLISCWETHNAVCIMFWCRNVNTASNRPWNYTVSGKKVPTVFWP